MEDSPNERRERVLVAGAGTPEVNGVFDWVGSSHNCGKYAKPGIWQQQERQFLIHHYNGGYWVIAVSTGLQILNETVLYRALPILGDVPDFPPKWGWERCHYGINPGTNPAPVLSILPPNVTEITSIIKPAASAVYENLLLSEDFSDVKFVCPDRQVVPAHRCVLAAASPYFKAAFSGLWKNNQDVEHETMHSAQVIKTVLTMIYTGTVESELAVAKEPLAFLSIASEYDLPWLQKIAEDECAHSLDADNLKQVWQAGRLYDSSTLKNACIRYAKKNTMAVMLSDCSITRLQMEDPESWRDFAEALEEPNEKRKRVEN